MDLHMLSAAQLSAKPNGARFYRADLHVHSFGASHDVKDRLMTPAAIIKAAINEDLDLIAITDHNEISGVSAAIEAAKGTDILVIPGIELSTPQGHLLCYLPTLDALQRFHGRLDICEQAWNKDPVFGVIGVQSGPR